jgi:hypothetical protein
MIPFRAGFRRENSRSQLVSTASLPLRFTVLAAEEALSGYSWSYTLSAHSDNGAGSGGGGDYLSA